MPLYDFRCPECGYEQERFKAIDADPPLCLMCHKPMVKGAGSISFIKIDGQGYPSRRKWMREWTPASPKFSTGSQHGERY